MLCEFAFDFLCNLGCLITADIGLPMLCQLKSGLQCYKQQSLTTVDISRVPGNHVFVIETKIRFFVELFWLSI